MEQVDKNVAFSDYGVDSILGVGFTEAINKRLELSLNPAILFDYTSIERLASHLIENFAAQLDRDKHEDRPDQDVHVEVAVASSATPVQSELQAWTLAAQEEVEERHNARSNESVNAAAPLAEIAVIGMSGQFPGATDVERFWENLIGGQHGVSELPANYLNAEQHFGAGAVQEAPECKWAGVLAERDCFDPLFFNISPREADSMNPHQRLVLQESWKALENAGYDPKSLSNANVGVYIGSEPSGYFHETFTGSSEAIIASRLSYFANLSGPTMVINTACSSSAAAIHLACEALRSGQIDMAIAGGVNASLSQAALVPLAATQMLSPSGRCSTFDDSANGTVLSEAVGIVVLKRLDSAVRDADSIAAVICASGVNQDGASNGITAPNGLAQERLIKDVYSRFGIDPADISYVEAHGTGTKLGDPVEANALVRAFRSFTDRKGYCALGSAKSHIGHAAAGAAVAGMIKVLLSLEHRQIPGLLHFNTLNSLIDLRDSAFYINADRKQWQSAAGKPRMAALNSFGHSGTNVHLVIREHLANAPRATARPQRVIVPLSARREDVLRNYAEKLLAHLVKHEADAPTLSDIAYTLQVGREPMAHRVAFLAGTVAELRRQLEEFLNNSVDGVSSWCGRVAGSQDEHAGLLQDEDLVKLVETWIAAGKLDKVARLWAKGAQVDWSAMWSGQTPRRVRLPTYPFLKNRHGKDTAFIPKTGLQGATLPHTDSGRVAAASSNSMVNALHPLAQRNTSTLEEQRFTSELSGREFFLSGHLVQGKPVLPGVAYLEMAHAAIRASLGMHGEQERIHLKNVVWQRPVVVTETQNIHIALCAHGKDEIEFEIYTNSPADEDIVHVQGRAVLTDVRNEAAVVDLTALRALCTQSIEVERCYEVIGAAGVVFGPALRGMSGMSVGTDSQGKRCVLARVTLPACVSETAGQYYLHPSVLDSALQVSIGLALAGSDAPGENIMSRPMLPFALEQLEVLNPSPAVAMVYVRPSAVPAAGGLQKLDVDICDEAGRVCVRLCRLTSRAIESIPDAKPLHPLLHSSAVSPKPSLGPSFTSVFSGDEFFLKDHHQLLPAVVYLEMARAAAEASRNAPVAGIRNVVWLDLMNVSDSDHKVQIDLSTERDGCAFEVSVKETASQAKLYAQGALTFDTTQPPSNPDRFDIAALRARCTVRLEGSECDRIIGASHGRRMFPIEWMEHTDHESLARLTLPDGLETASEHYVLHPSIMHGALIAAICFALIQDGHPQVRFPYALERLWIYSHTPRNGYVYVRPSEPGGSKQDIDVLDESGTCAIAMRGFTAVAAHDVRAEAAFYATPHWESQPIAAPAATDEHDPPVFVLTAENASLRQALQAQWQGARVEELASVGTDGAVAIQANFVRVLELLKRSIVAKPRRIQPIVVLLEENERSYVHAAFAGLLKSAAMENSRLLCKLVRYSAQGGINPASLLNQLRAELAAPGRDVEVRYRDGNREIRRLRELQLRAGRSVAETVSAGDVVWITGGLGGLGQIFARHFGAVPGVKIIVSGRSALESNQRAALGELRGQAADVHYLRCDVSNPDQVRSLVQTVQREFGGLSGIIHCAGVIRDSYLVNKTLDEVQAVLAPKIGGVLTLDEVTRHLSLNFMVLCSSLAAGGGAGQADYAGANSFIDEFAQHRNELVRQGHRKGHTLAVNWPLWREGGMQVAAQLEELNAHITGMRAMDTQIGMQSLLAAMVEKQTQLLVAAGDVKKIRAVLLQVPPDAVSNDKPVSSLTRPPSGERLAADRGGEHLLDRVVQELIQAAAALLTLDRHLIDPQTDLSRYGFDSISLTGFANQLNRRYGLELMPTVFFECSTLDSLGQYLVKHHEAVLRSKLNAARDDSTQRVQAGGAPEARRPGRSRSLSGRRGLSGNFADATQQLTERGHRVVRQRRSDAAPEAIAIIGMSGCFPQSPDIESFWRALDEGRDCITEIPPERWDWRAIYGDPNSGGFKTNVKWGGFIDSAMSFDPLFFGISPREAESMDPQQRLLLTHAWKVIEDAGYAPSSLAGTRTAVYVGTADTGYSMLVAQASQSIEGFSGTGVAQSVGPNRVSFLLDLHGPSEPIDTACSSSMVAIHRAVNALRVGQCGLAIAGGVNTILTPTVHVGYAKAGMLSPEGRCKAFSAQADGFARGEGAGLLLLKRLSEAEAAGDHIYGVILHIGENHGGRATSLTAPNMKSQAELIRSVHEEAQIDPRTVTYIEAHGTGTQLGDPVEFNGLKSAFEALNEKTANSALPAQRCGLGSVKSNIGHLELASGVAGVIKVLLQMKHKRLVRSLHCQTINPYIDLQHSPFYIVDENREWVALRDAQGSEIPRRAGISSFGFAGVNTHALIEEYCGSRAAREPLRGPYVLVLSARTDEQLKQQAKNLLHALQTDRYTQEDLVRIAYTLQVGRDALGERLGFVANGLLEVQEKLQAYLQVQSTLSGIYRGQVKAGKAALSIFRDSDELREAIGKWLERGRYEALLELWVQGLDMDWEQLYGEQRPGRISLPTYPFSQEIYWAFEVPRGDGAATSAEQEGSHASAVSVAPQAELPSNSTDAVDVETTFTLTPVWDPVALAQDSDANTADTRFVCVGIDRGAVRNLAQRAARAEALDLQPNETIEQIAQRFEQLQRVDHIVWAFRNPTQTDVAADAVIEAQQAGVMLCFKVIKALIKLGYQNRKLTWTVLTERAIALSQTDTVVAVHAGVHGLMGSLAKENPNWAVHVIDLSTYSQHPALLADCLQLPTPQPWDDDLWAHRNGSWYRQRLLNFEMLHA